MVDIIILNPIFSYRFILVVHFFFRPIFYLKISLMIMGDKDPYPTFLGIDWAFENYNVIDLKHETMNFEVDGVRVL